MDGFKGEYDCDEWIDNRGFYIEIWRLRCLRVNYGFCEIMVISAKIYKNWELIN